MERVLNNINGLAGVQVARRALFNTTTSNNYFMKTFSIIWKELLMGQKKETAYAYRKVAEALLNIQFIFKYEEGYYIRNIRPATSRSHKPTQTCKGIG